jgi:Spy/CpxP family protein refolding chaperone
MVPHALKITSFVMMAVALTLASNATLLSGGVSAKPADSSTSSKTTPVSNQNASSASLMEQLKLTDKQKNEIRTIRANRTKQINQILTPDQKTKFEQARKSGKTLSEALKELNLKPDQKSKILAIAKDSADQIKSKLNPDQLKQLTAYIKQHQRGATAPVE